MAALTVDALRPVALWAADCAARVLPLYEAAAPGDHRPREAVDGARMFGRGARRDRRMRTLAFAALTAARETTDPSARSAARAAQMAVAVAYTHLDLTGTAAARQTMHLLAPAVYAAQARELDVGDPAAADDELVWAAEHSDTAVKLVLTAMPAPDAGSTRLGQLYRSLDAELRHPPGRDPKRPVSVETLGAWVIKCNPGRTPVDPMLAGGETKPQWCIADNYRSRLIEPGQRVLFWVSAHPRRGFWGAGRITGRPTVEDCRLHVPVRIPLFAEPLTAAELSTIPGLRAMEVFRSPQQSNPSWVSVAELALLAPLLPAGNA
ncbi:putative immunity protein [Mycolicibacterium litorale]|uniref:putative immunity protein n=1 Tax=Mycolicibacterium litorale TaxID=758802 RepID=UPI003CF0771F